jgi:hypothetical protein
MEQKANFVYKELGEMAIINKPLKILGDYQA